MVRYFMAGYVAEGGRFNAGYSGLEYYQGFPSREWCENELRILYGAKKLIITSLYEFKNKEEYDMWMKDETNSN